MLEAVGFLRETCEIVKALEKIGPSATAEQIASRIKYPTRQVEQHLEELYASGFVEKETNGDRRTYRINAAIEPILHFPFNR